MGNLARTSRLILALLLVVSSRGNGFAIEDLLFSSNFGGLFPRDVALRGDVVYVPTGGTLRVLRLQGAEDPLLLQEVHLGDETTDLLLRGDELHLSARGIYRRFSVLADGTLRQTSSLAPEVRFYNHVATGGDLLLLHETPPRGLSRLHLFRFLADQDSPVRLDEIAFAINDMTMLDGRAFIARGPLLSRFEASAEDELVETSQHNTGLALRSVVIAGGFLYVGSADGIILVYDPLAPLEDGPVATHPSFGGAITSLAEDDARLFARIGSGTVGVFSLDSPTTPVLTAQSPVAPAGGRFAVSGHRLIEVPTSSARLDEYSVDAPGNLVLQRQTERAGPLLSALVENDLVYAASSYVGSPSRFEVYRARPGREHERIGVYPPPGEGELFLSGLDKIGETIVGFRSFGLFAIDVSDPAAPQLRGQLALDPGENLVGTTGIHAVFESGARLRTISFANPDDLFEAQRLEEVGVDHLALELRGDTVASVMNEDGTRRIAIYRILPDGTIERRSTTDAPAASFRTISVTDSLLAVGVTIGGIDIYRRRLDDDTLSYLTRARASELYLSVALGGERLSGIRQDFSTIPLIDVSQPDSPLLLTQRVFSRASGHIGFAGNQLLYVDIHYGLIALDIADLPPTSFVLY